MRIKELDKNLNFHRYDNGVKLIEANKNSSKDINIKNSLSSLLEIPIPIWFSNRNSEGIYGNEANSVNCGFASIKDSIGRTMLDVLKKEDALQIMKNDKDAMQLKTMKIAEENSLRNDGVVINALVFKMPCYNDYNEIIGLFGCAIILGVNSLAESLSHIVDLGILDSKKIPLGRKIDSIYFTQREMECLRLTIKGKTAKQIACILELSHWTVEEYLANVKLKLGVKKKSELIEKTIDYFI